MKTIPYKEIFTNIEATLRKVSSHSEDEFNSSFGSYKNYENQILSDDEYYDNLVEVIFYSGFKASTVSQMLPTIKKHLSNYQIVATYDENKIEEIMADTSMLRNKRKIRACINNAIKFKATIQEYGSFSNYVDSYKPNESFENLLLFKEDLQDFDYLGGITAYHFMTDIGLNVIKPDLVITRIFKRLGLISDEGQLLKTVIHGRKFSQATNMPIRYVDIILVKYGQLGPEKSFGLSDGICVEKKPKCDICGITGYCEYFSNSVNS